MRYHVRVLAPVVAICGTFLVACDRIDDVEGTVPPFADLDANNDGQLSRQETRAVPDLAGIFQVADTDKDGVLSISEFSQATLEGVTVSAEAAAGHQFELLDTNDNQRLSAEEVEEFPALAANFSDFDNDGSGSLDSSEYDRALTEGFTP